jgi:exodeoxyribonuclease VII small subunit
VNRKEKSAKTQLPDLENSLNEINSLITNMEQGNLSLEQSLEKFERGITLIKHCQKVLQEAEQKVQILIQNEGQDDLQPYENNPE